jgi:FkbM family methyltransferase
MFHSQFKQDEYVEKTIFKGYKNGIFMDIGAHDGVTFNNTLYFEKVNGWTGYNIEPIKRVYDKLVENRPACVNIQCAISNVDGSAEFLCNTGHTEMISGLKESYDKRHFERLERENRTSGGATALIQVNTHRFETICDKYNIRHIHYLSIDVEGAEFDVIKSINFDKVFIDVIEFENNYIDTTMPIIRYLQSKGYRLLCVAHDIFMIHTFSAFPCD